MPQCPVCKGRTEKYLTAGDYNQNLSGDRFDYFCCNECNLLYLDPVPDDLGSYYTADYPAYRMPTLQDLEERAAAERYKLEIVRKFAGNGRLLELGPSFGAFAYLAKKSGYEVTAIEMDAGCCRFLTEVVGIRAVNSCDTADAVRGVEGQFDVVVMWHVLEHLIDPFGVLEAAAGALAPGGVLILATPNPASLQFRVFRQYWTHLDAPRHLSLIPPTLLTAQAGALGLTPVSVTTTDSASAIFSSFGWWCVSLANVLGQKRFVLGATVYRKAAKAFLGLLYLLLFRSWEAGEGHGAAYTAVYGKQDSTTRD